VTTAEQLKALGSVEAALRLRALAKKPEDAPCASMLSGLEGAIQGVRWHAIPKHEREALWRRYQARCEGGEEPRP
jgi:DNA transformation protein